MFKNETVRSVKTVLRRGISCETNWTPQQSHYTIRLYNQHYQELDDKMSLMNLVEEGVIWNEDDIYMILEVDSGRFVTYIDKFIKNIRFCCIGMYPLSVRENPNHNYMFQWKEDPPESYSPPPLQVPPNHFTKDQDIVPGIAHVPGIAPTSDMTLYTANSMDEDSDLVLSDDE